MNSKDKQHIYILNFTFTYNHNKISTWTELESRCIVKNNINLIFFTFNSQFQHTNMLNNSDK